MSRRQRGVSTRQQAWRYCSPYRQDGRLLHRMSVRSWQENQRPPSTRWRCVSNCWKACQQVSGFIRRQDGWVRRDVGYCQPAIGERGQGVRLVWLAFGIVNRTFGYGRFYYQPFRLICPLFRLNRTDSKTGGEFTEGNA